MISDPREGLLGLRGRRDYAIASLLGAGAFVLSFVNYWLPNQKIFDEVYFPRAAAEYLMRQPIYENTHPPLTKLIIVLSMLLFGGLHGLGDTPWGWRFMDVLFGALVVVLLFAFAKRVTGSTPFAAIAALLLAVDGMHFVQSRIATPEGIVVFLALAVLYAFYRFWICEQRVTAAPETGTRPAMAWAAGVALAAGLLGSWLIVNRAFHQSKAATIVLGMYAAAGIYLLLRLVVLPRAPALGTRAAAYAGAARRWLIATSLALGCLVSSKWYGVMGFGVCFAVLIGVWAQRFLRREERTVWGEPRAYRLDVALVTIAFLAASVYLASWTKDLLDQADIHNATEIVYRQYSMFEYHEHLNDNGRNQHPYASKWWEWPLDLRPVYYYADFGPHWRRVIYSLPNPIVLWLGVFSVPMVGYLGWRERRKGYVLVTLAYLLQWLPWAASPRITFAYHFYVDIPLICLCDAIALQRFWEWSRTRSRWQGPALVGGYVALAAAAFVFFYPILAGTPISDAYWNATRWLPSWT